MSPIHFRGKNCCLDFMKSELTHAVTFLLQKLFDQTKWRYGFASWHMAKKNILLTFRIPNIKYMDHQSCICTHNKTIWQNLVKKLNTIKLVSRLL